MKTTTTTFDFDRTVALFADFYAFHRKQQLKKIRSNLIMILAGSLIIAGMITGHSYLAQMGIAITCALFAFIVWFSWSSHRATKKIAESLYAEKDAVQGNHQFGFDNQKMVYISKGQKSEVKWDRFKFYQPNGRAIYLFASKKRLAEIIAEEVIGEEMFESFQKTIENKGIPKLYPKA